MSTFALAYEDYVQRGVWDFAGYESMPGDIVGDIRNLQDMRLGKCVARASGGVSDFVNVWQDPAGEGSGLPMQIISVLDVRKGEGTFVINLGYLDGDGELVEIEYTPAIWPTSDFVQHMHLILPEQVSAKGLLCSVTGSDTTWSIGRLWTGPLLRGTVGIQNRWECSIIDPGEMGLSRGGQGYPELRQRRRRLDMQLSAVPYELAFGNADNTVLDLQQLGYRVGTTGTVIAFPRTLNDAGDPDTHAIHRLGVYGHFADPLAIRHVAGSNFDARLRVEELL